MLFHPQTNSQSQNTLFAPHSKNPPNAWHTLLYAVPGVAVSLIVVRMVEGVWVLPVAVRVFFLCIYFDFLGFTCAAFGAFFGCFWHASLFCGGSENKV